MLPRDPRDVRSEMLEIRVGAGGDEACIWAGDLARMYGRYGQKLGWSVQQLSCTEADLGGYRELIVSVKSSASCMITFILCSITKSVMPKS